MPISQFKKLGRPLPLPRGRKDPPPEGTTGINGQKRNTWREVSEHVANGGNWGMVPIGYVIIDVDAYSSDEADEAARYFVTRYNLQATFKTSARAPEDALSGHYWFQLPSDHNSGEVSFSKKVKPKGQPCIDIIHQHAIYAVMPGSEVEGRSYEVVNDVAPLPIPTALYELLLRPAEKYQPLSDKALLLVTESQIDAQRNRVRAGQIELRFTKLGNRDNQSLCVCRDIGALWRMSRDTAEKEQHVTTVRGILGRIGADAQTGRSVDRHVAYGYDNVTLRAVDVESYDWWFSRESYESVFWEAVHNLRSPMALLLSKLTWLALATDHRIRIDPWFGDFKPAPINLWSALVGRSGSGKSSGATLARTWLNTLAIEMPPIPAPQPLYTLGGKYGHDPDTHRGERMLIPHDSVLETTTANGIPALFEGTAQPLSDKRLSNKAKTGYRRMLYYDEPDQLFGLVAKSYNLLAALRPTFYSLERSHRIGKQGHSTHIAANSYSLQLMICLTPDAMGRFYETVGTGFMERLIFVDASNDVVDIHHTYRGTLQKPIWADVAAWTPPLRKGRTVRGRVSLDPEGIDFLRQWAMWDADNYHSSPSYIDKDTLARFKAFTMPLVGGHTSVQAARLATLLARFNGVPMDAKGRVEIPFEYLEDALVILAESIKVIRTHIEERKVKQDIAMVTQITQQAKRAKAVRKAELEVELESTRLERYADTVKQCIRDTGGQITSTRYNKMTFYQHTNFTTDEELEPFGIATKKDGRKKFYVNKEKE